MPIDIAPKGQEDENSFISRCLKWMDERDEFVEGNTEEETQDQRKAVCYDTWRKAKDINKFLCQSDEKRFILKAPNNFKEGDLISIEDGKLTKKTGFNTSYPKKGEDETYEYIVQIHARLRSLHCDLRMEGGPDDYLRGFTLLDQIEDKVDVPIVTLPQLKRKFEEHKEDWWKINWATGDLKPRETRGGKREHGNIRVIPKAPEPKEWAAVQSATDFPPNWPKTIVEWWDKWSEKTQDELEEKGWDLERAKTIEEGDETWDERPEDEPVGGSSDGPGVFLIIDSGSVEYSALKPWFNEFYFHSDKGLLEGKYFFRMISTKEKEKDILPPGEEEERRRQGFYTIMGQAIDQLPYTVSEEAQDPDWVPPQGWSCIPEKWRENVPEDYQYWTHETEDKRIKVRNKFLEGENVRKVLGVPKVEKEISKAGQFSYSFLRFRGPIVIRFGPSSGSQYQIRLEFEDEKRIFSTTEDISNLNVEDSEMGYDSTDELPFDSKWFLTEQEVIEPEPQTVMNPAKTKIASFEYQDSGEAKLIDKGEGYIKFELSGEELKGTFFARQEEAGSEFWEVERVHAEPETEKELRVLKEDDESQVIYGVAMRPNYIDLQNDKVSPGEVEEAAWKALKHNAQITLSHEEGLSKRDAYICENYIAPVDFRMGGKQVKEGDWVLGVKIENDDLWEAAKEGAFRGFSIGGWADRIVSTTHR